MGDEALKAAQSCAKPQIKGYRGLNFPREIVEHARENSPVIRTCYAQVPEARDKELAKELKRAHRALRRNFFYQSHSRQGKATDKRAIDSAYWIIPGSDLRYTNACVKAAYKEPTRDPQSFQKSFENMQLVHRCVEDPAQRKTAQRMELARTAEVLQTSPDSSNPRLNLARAAIAAIENSEASCLIPRYRSYEEDSFATGIVSNAHDNAEEIRTCYQNESKQRKQALVANRAQARHFMKEDFFFRTGTTEEHSWLLAGIDAVTWTYNGADSYRNHACIQGGYKSYDYDRRNYPKQAFSIAKSNGDLIRRCLPKGKERSTALALESNRAIAAMRSADSRELVPDITTDLMMRQVLRGGKMPEWPPEPERKSLTPAQEKAAGEALLFLAKGLFSIVCGAYVGVPLTIAGASKGKPGLGWDACTFVW